MAAGHLGINDILRLDIIFGINITILQKLSRDITLSLQHAGPHAPHSFVQQNIASRAETGAFHDAHHRNIALCPDAVALQNIAMNNNAACKVNVSHGIVHIAGHSKYILHMETAGPEGQVALAASQQPVPFFGVHNVFSLGNRGHGSLFAVYRLSVHIHAVLRFGGKGNIADHIPLLHIMYQVRTFKVDSPIALGGVLYLGFSGEIILNAAVLPVSGRLAPGDYNHLQVLFFTGNTAYLLPVYAKAYSFLLQRAVYHFLRYIKPASGRPVNHHGYRHPVI